MYIRLAIAIISLTVYSCTTDQEHAPKTLVLETDEILEIPSKTVDISALDFQRSTSRWTLDSVAYSGYCTSTYDDGQLEKKFGIVEGRKEGPSTYWFPDGHLKSTSSYKRGKLHGEKKNWSLDSTHLLLAQLNYVNGKGHGIQRKWYATGEPYLVLNLNMGKEEGLQKAYRKNGDLYANYEAKEGRIFGMKKAQLCFGIESETINYEGD